MTPRSPSSPCWAPRSTTEALITALSVIARDIKDPYGTTVAAILEARDRLAEALLIIKETRTHIPKPRRADTPYGKYVLFVHQFCEIGAPNASDHRADQETSHGK